MPHIHDSESLSAVTLRRLENTLVDVQQVVQVHLRAFPQSAITQLGSEAAYRYYQWQFEGPHDMTAFGAFAGNRLVGFCFAGIFRGALGGFLDRNRDFLIRQVLTHPWLILNPLVREKIGYTLSRFRKMLHRPPSESNVSSVKSPPHFSILSIAVDPDLQGQGIGKQLLAAAEANARKRQFTQIYLSVLPDNQMAVLFYERNGYQRHLQNHAVWHGTMVKQLEDCWSQKQ